jgi:shikimate kinase
MPPYQNIYLIGFRASGKTTVARQISSSYGLSFLDADEKLQQDSGMSIEDVVVRHGWDYFREMEKKILADTAQSRGLVVATGGGVILREPNRDILRNSKHFTVYLKARPGLINDRLKQDPHPGQRPPLSNLSLEDEISQSLAQREPLYHECADLVLDAHEKAEKLARVIMEKFSGVIS